MITHEAAKRAHRCLQSVWVIVSASHDDAVAAEVAAMGKRLSTAIESNDLVACARSVEEVRAWLCTSAGVVVSRLQYVFEEP